MNMSFSAFMKEATSEAKSWYERLKTSPVDEKPIGGYDDLLKLEQEGKL